MKREVRIGVFMGIISVVLVIFVFVVGDIGNLFRKKGYSLRASFETTAGLEKRAVVRMAGVKIGNVYDILLEGVSAEVVMHIEHDIKVRKDSKASLALLSLLGERYVEILPGKIEEYCQPGDSIEGLSAQSFEEVGVALTDVGKDLKEAAAALKKLIGDAESPGTAMRTLQDVTVFVEGLNALLHENKDSVRETLQLSTEAVKAFEARVGEVSENVNDLVRTMKDVVEESQEDVSGQMRRIKDLMNKLEEALVLLTETLDRINTGKGSLGKLINEPELYEDAEEAVQTLQRVAQPLSSFQADLNIQAEYFSQSALMRSQLSFILWPSNGKYVLAQIVQDPWEEQFTFTLQGGVRWKDLSARAGMIESTFGAGVDYYAFNDRLMMSIEGFDFNRDTQPHFRLKAQVVFFKHLFVVIGIDDFTLVPDREMFFGIGFKL
jgi:virulence factor Mce-like protein